MQISVEMLLITAVDKGHITFCLALIQLCLQSYIIGCILPYLYSGRVILLGNATGCASSWKTQHYFTCNRAVRTVVMNAKVEEVYQLYKAQLNTQNMKVISPLFQRLSHVRNSETNVLIYTSYIVGHCFPLAGYHK